jgi:hypothetical protein
MWIDKPTVGPTRTTICAGLLASPACGQKIEESAPKLHFDLLVDGRVVSPMMARAIRASKLGHQLAPGGFRQENHALEQLRQIRLSVHA